MPRVSSRSGFEQIPCTEMSHFVIRSCLPGAPARLCRRSGFLAMNKAWCTAVALAGLVSVFGCGGDEGTTPAPVGTAGFGGGTAGFAGTAAAAGTGAMAPIPCGTVMCSAPAIPPGLGIMLSPPCCADAATSTCGTTSGGMCKLPPPPAPLCPAPMLFGMTLKACCVTATNMCGIDGSMLGMGCVGLGGIPGVGAGMPMTRCDGTVVMPPPTTTPVAGSGTGTAGTGTAGATAGTGTVGGAGGAGGSTATSGAGGSTTTAGAGGATAGAGGARAGTGGATAGAGGRGF
jgi:hypothetical protein